MIRQISDHDRFRLNRKLSEIAERVERGDLPLFKVMDALSSVLQGTFEEEFPSGSQSLPLIINYNFPIAQALVAGGYNRITPGIVWAQLQPCPLGKHEVAVELINFRKEMPTEEVVANLKTAHYRFLKPFELLVLGAQYPEEQKRSRIVTLDFESEFDQAFVLHGRYRHRSLSRYFLHDIKQWPADTRFAVAWDQFNSVRQK